jgi:hypothetical protein
MAAQHPKQSPAGKASRSLAADGRVYFRSGSTAQPPLACLDARAHVPNASTMSNLRRPRPRHSVCSCPGSCSGTVLSECVVQRSCGCGATQSELLVSGMLEHTAQRIAPVHLPWWTAVTAFRKVSHGPTQAHIVSITLAAMPRLPRQCRRRFQPSRHLIPTSWWRLEAAGSSQPACSELR